MLGPSEESFQSAAFSPGFNTFSFSSPHQPSTTQDEEAGLPTTQGPWFKAIEAAALAEDFLHIDHEIVPCSPLTELRGLCFLSSSAKEELAKNLRPDVLLPSDNLQLFLFRGRSLMAAGKVRLGFPSYFGAAMTDALVKDPLGVDVARHSHFFFELGEALCKLIPEHEWPHPNLLQILQSARRQRRCLLATESVAFDKALLNRLTFEEKETVQAIQNHRPFMGPFA